MNLMKNQHLVICVIILGLIRLFTICILFDLDICDLAGNEPLTGTGKLLTGNM